MTKKTNKSEFQEPMADYAQPLITYSPIFLQTLFFNQLCDFLFALFVSDANKINTFI